MKYLFLFILTLSLVSCEKDIPKATENTDAKLLSELQSGDKLYYRLLSGEGYHQKPSHLYRKDTLIIEIISNNNNIITYDEYIAKGSEMMNKDDLYFPYKKQRFQNQWILRNDSILFNTVDSSRYYSHLISYNHMDGLPLQVDTDIEVKIESWITSYPYNESNKLAYIANLKLDNMDYGRSIVNINNEPMTYDANGATIIYNSDYGIIRSSEYSWWTQSGYTWERIQQPK